MTISEDAGFRVDCGRGGEGFQGLGIPKAVLLPGFERTLGSLGFERGFRVQLPSPKALNPPQAQWYKGELHLWSRVTWKLANILNTRDL